MLVFLSEMAVAQLDRYKYIQVPLQFDGFKKVNQFQTSTLIKYNFVQQGFNAIYDNAIPPDLAQNPCLGLKTQFIDDSSLLRTKVRLALLDCEGELVFETLEGSSKAKDYKLAYQEAIQNAMMSFNGLIYFYTPEEGAVNEMSDTKTPVVSAETEVSSSEKMAVVAPAVSTGPGGEEEVSDVLYAQPIDNGYNLMDASRNVQMQLLKTSREDTYIAMIEGSTRGMVYKKEGSWWHEYYQDGKPILGKLHIEF